eukprot:6934410-Prymnesium_polylepis.2
MSTSSVRLIRSVRTHPVQSRVVYRTTARTGRQTPKSGTKTQKLTRAVACARRAFTLELVNAVRAQATAFITAYVM